jgi:DNA-directed RNA polymerase subunit F
MCCPVSKTILALTLAAGMFAPAVFGQHKNAPQRQQKAQPPPPPSAAGRSGAAPQRPLNPNNPGTILDRWNAMTPAQREKALAKLPPERQKQIRERVQRFNQQFSQLPKDDQQRLREGLQKINRMPPAEQQAIRTDFRRFGQLPPDRRQALQREFAKLRKMPESERINYLASDQFRSRFSPDEQQIAQNISKVYPDPHQE